MARLDRSPSKSFPLPSAHQLCHTQRWQAHADVHLGSEQHRASPHTEFHQFTAAGRDSHRHPVVTHQSLNRIIPFYDSVPRCFHVQRSSFLLTQCLRADSVSRCNLRCCHGLAARPEALTVGACKLLVREELNVKGCPENASSPISKLPSIQQPQYGQPKLLEPDGCQGLSHYGTQTGTWPAL